MNKGVTERSAVNKGVVNKSGEIMFRNITNQKVTDYINAHYTAVNDKLAKLRQEAEQKDVPIILRDTETLILSLLNIYKPKRVLEIGTAVGYSAICMAEFMPELKITTLEHSDDAYEAAVRNIKAFDLEDRIQALKGDAVEIMRKMAEKGSRSSQTVAEAAKREPAFDMVFIDAAKSHYREFFDASLALCGDNPLIVCDNILFKGRVVSDEYDINNKYKTSVKKMREFVEYLFSLEGYHTSLLSVGDGVTITTKKRGEL